MRRDACAEACSVAIHRTHNARAEPCRTEQSRPREPISRVAGLIDERHYKQGYIAKHALIIPGQNSSSSRATFDGETSRRRDG